MILQPQLVANCRKTPERRAWLQNLPELLEELTDRWSLRVGEPFDKNGSCAWVAPVVRVDGTQAVLKLAMPHMESENEIQGLRYWNGNGMVKLLEADEGSGAMLLERCLPGTPLRAETEQIQDEIIAGVLKRLWEVTKASHDRIGFRPLSQMIDL
jgi:streptomycin 6-kinase